MFSTWRYIPPWSDPHHRQSSPSTVTWLGHPNTLGKIQTDEFKRRVMSLVLRSHCTCSAGIWQRVSENGLPASYFGRHRVLRSSVTSGSLPTGWVGHHGYHICCRSMRGQWYSVGSTHAGKHLASDNSGMLTSQPGLMYTGYGFLCPQAPIQSQPKRRKSSMKFNLQSAFSFVDKHFKLGWRRHGEWLFPDRLSDSDKVVPAFDPAPHTGWLERIAGSGGGKLGVGQHKFGTIHLHRYDRTIEQQGQL